MTKPDSSPEDRALKRRAAETIAIFGSLKKFDDAALSDLEQRLQEPALTTSLGLTPYGRRLLNAMAGAVTARQHEDKANRHSVDPETQSVGAPSPADALRRA